MTWLQIKENQCHRWTWRWSVCLNLNPILSPDIACLKRVTRWVQLVEQELSIFPEHLRSLPFCRVSCALSLAFRAMFCRSLFVFLSFYFWSSVLLLITPFGTFKLFLVNVPSESNNLRLLNYSFILNAYTLSSLCELYESKEMISW